MRAAEVRAIAAVLDKHPTCGEAVWDTIYHLTFGAHLWSCEWRDVAMLLVKNDSKEHQKLVRRARLCPSDLLVAQELVRAASEAAGLDLETGLRR